MKLFILAILCVGALASDYPGVSGEDHTFQDEDHTFQDEDHSFQDDDNVSSQHNQEIQGDFQPQLSNHEQEQHVLPQTSVPQYEGAIPQFGGAYPELGSDHGIQSLNQGLNAQIHGDGISSLGLGGSFGGDNIQYGGIHDAGLIEHGGIISGQQQFGQQHFGQEQYGSQVISHGVPQVISTSHQVISAPQQIIASPQYMPTPHYYPAPVALAPAYAPSYSAAPLIGGGLGGCECSRHRCKCQRRQARRLRRLQCRRRRCGGF